MTDEIFVFQVRQDTGSCYDSSWRHTYGPPCNVCKMLVVRPNKYDLDGGIGTFDKLQEETRSLRERDRQCDPVEENKNSIAVCFFPSHLLPSPPDIN